MLRYIAALSWLATATYAGEPSGQYSFHINWVFVTPEYLKETEIPFQFDLVERDAGQFTFSLMLAEPTKQFGAASACEVIVSTISLSTEDKPAFEDVNAAVAEKNRKKTIEVAVPTETKKSVSRFLVFTRSEIERSLVRVRYSQPGYGGDVYWVLLGRFVEKKADQAPEKTPSVVTPPAAQESRRP